MSLARKPQSLKDERARLFTEAEGMLDRLDAENRDFTKAEEKRYNGILASIDSNTKMQELQKMNPNPRQPGESEIFPPIGGDPMAGRITSASYGGSVKAFANTREGKESAYRSGRFLMATLLGDENSRVWCNNHGMDADRAIRMVHSGGENTKGGVLVPEELSSSIIRLVEEYGLFRRLARVAPMGSDTLNIPRRTGGLSAYYTGENQEGQESGSQWDLVALVARKLMVLSSISSEILEDNVISLSDTLATEAALAFAIKEDTVGFTGTGISTDGGIVGVNVKAIDGSHGMATVAAASGHDTLPEIDADDLINLLAAVPLYAKRGAAWVCSPTAEEVVFNAIRIAAAGNTADILVRGQPSAFLGYPIEVTDVYPDSVSTNYNGLPMIGFGNLSQACTLGTRREIRMALSSDRYFELDQIGVKATMRHDINVHDLGSDTVKSPFVVLTGTT